MIKDAILAIYRSCRKDSFLNRKKIILFDIDFYLWALRLLKDSKISVSRKLNKLKSTTSKHLESYNFTMR